MTRFSKHFGISRQSADDWFLRLAAVMVGAAMTNQFLLEESPWLPRPSW